MRQKYLKVTAVLDEAANEKLVAWKEKLPDGEQQVFSVTVGNYRRFRKRNLIKKIRAASQTMHCFSLVLNDWKAVSDSEIRLYPEQNEFTEQISALFCFRCREKEEQKPYVTLLKGTAEQIGKASELLKETFAPFAVGICALELDKTCPPMTIQREALLPAPEERTVKEEEPAAIDLEQILLKDLQPSQFYISEEKLRKTEQWFDPNDLSNFEPISVKVLDGKLVMLDGHTRAVAALNAGLEKLPLVWETEEWDWDMYRRCVHECEQRDIFSPLDLVPRVISAAEYWEKWDAWCDRMQAEVEAARKTQ